MILSHIFRFRYFTVCVEALLHKDSSAWEFGWRLLLSVRVPNRSWWFGNSGSKCIECEMVSGGIGVE